VHSAQAFVITFNERGGSFIRRNGAANFYFASHVVAAENCWDYKSVGKK